MSTGIESWNVNLLDIGPMYPFPGTEVFWVVIGLATWILWHLIQISMENKVYNREDAHYQDSAMLEKAMTLSEAETLVEVMKAHEPENFKAP